MVISAQFHQQYKRHAPRATRNKLSRARILGLVAVLITVMVAMSRSTYGDTSLMDFRQDGSWKSIAGIGGQAIWLGRAGMPGRAMANSDGLVEATMTQWKGPPQSANLVLDDAPKSALLATQIASSGDARSRLAQPMLAGLGLGILILLIGWGLTRPRDVAHRGAF
jgi:hypothetical protein